MTAAFVFQFKRTMPFPDFSFLISSLTDALAKDSNNLDPARVINISSIASRLTSSTLTIEGHGVWSCSWSCFVFRVVTLADFYALHLKITQVKLQLITFPRSWPRHLHLSSLRRSTFWYLSPSYWLVRNQRQCHPSWVWSCPYLQYTTLS